MGLFVEVLDHPDLTKAEREFIGMKGRKVASYPQSGRTFICLTDKRDVTLPDTALRPIPKRRTE